MKKLSIIAACVLVVGLLGGCGSKLDATGYIQALLDNSYKNDSTQFVELKIGTAEEAADLYEQGLDAEVDAFVGAVNAMLSPISTITDEQSQYLKQVFADIFAGARYTVGEAEKQDDNSFVVTISYEQMHVFAPAMKTFNADVEDMINEWTEEVQAGGDLPADEEIADAVVSSLIDAFENSFAEAVYDEPQTTTVRIELINNVYTPKQSDFTNLESVMFDYGDLANVNQ